MCPLSTIGEVIPFSEAVEDSHDGGDLFGAHNQCSAKLERVSRTLEEEQRCVLIINPKANANIYCRWFCGPINARYKRPPPRGFDDWYLSRHYE